MPTTTEPAMTDMPPEIDPPCDRCGPAVRATYRARRIGELYLCGHCANRLWAALEARGWTIWMISEYALASHTRDNEPEGNGHAW